MGYRMKEYKLLNQDYELLEFSHESTLMGDTYKIIKVNDEYKEYLPKRIRKNLVSDELSLWLANRVSPTGRHHMEAVLNAINLQNHFDVLMYAHGLSLNDTYWLKECDDCVSFDEVNLYDNKFDMALGWLAFTGLPSNISKTLGTPELTTVGCLPKYWERIGSMIQMCKGGTGKYANAGGEPVSECVASLIGRYLGLDCVEYRFETRKVEGAKKAVSVSNLFTTKNEGLLVAQDAITDMFGSYKGVTLVQFVEKLLPSCRKKFFDLCFFDWLVKNEDRHLSNWGFMVNNLTGEITRFAPIWDTGISLMWSSMESDFPEEYEKEPLFSSFGIEYRFILESEYRKDYCLLCRKLLRFINSGELLLIIDPWYKLTDNHQWKALYVVEMLRRRCEEYLAYSRADAGMREADAF